MTAVLPSPSTLDDQLSAVAFLGPRDGYAYFVHQGAVSCIGEVGPTADGGAVFGPLVTATSWDCADNPPVHYLALDGGGDVFLFDPRLVVSHDGGKSWAPSSQLGSVLTVEAVGRSVWALVQPNCLSLGAIGCRLGLMESGDGGRTWSSHLVPETVVNPALGLGAAGQTWLVRTDRWNATLVSAPVLDHQGRPDEALLWLTADGGATWSRRSVPCHMDAMSVSLSVAPTGTLFAVCAGQPSAGWQPKSALRSSDGGSTWALKSSCVLDALSAPGCNSPIDGGYLAGVAAISAKTVFVYGDRSSLLVSHDGGTKWAPVRPLIGDTSWGTPQVVFFNRSSGVVLGDNPSNNDVISLWSTQDGGLHWRAVAPLVR